MVIQLRFSPKFKKTEDVTTNIGSTLLTNSRNKTSWENKPTAIIVETKSCTQKRDCRRTTSGWSSPTSHFTFTIFIKTSHLYQRRNLEQQFYGNCASHLYEMMKFYIHFGKKVRFGPLHLQKYFSSMSTPNSVRYQFLMRHLNCRKLAYLLFKF